ncbi:hypothetical protein [Micromonospora coerulea]
MPPDRGKFPWWAGHRPVAGGMPVLQVVEWPPALVSAAGHLLADQHLSGW